MEHIKVLIAHPGTQHAKYLALELYKRQLLYKYCSGLMIAKDNMAAKYLLPFLPANVRRKINYRLIDTIPNSAITNSAWNEFRTLARVHDPAVYKEKVFFKRNENFQKSISSIHLNSCKVIVGFDTSSWILAEKAKKLKKSFILDHTTAEATGRIQVLQQVSTLYPEWKFNIEPRYGLYNTTDHIEHELSDIIVVASSYTKKTLIEREVPAEKILVNPYGVNTEVFSPGEKNPPKGKIKFLFVGAVSALKGIPLLLDAWNKIDSNKAELLIVGCVSDVVRQMIGTRKGIKLLGTFPKEQLRAVYRSAHVFVFPSFTEGFGQVILEAMACGLPVITTENTAGCDLIVPGEEGYVIPAGDLEALTASINYFIENPTSIKKMSSLAREKAVTYTWSSYGDRWEDIIKNVLLHG